MAVWQTVQINVVQVYIVEMSWQTSADIIVVLIYWNLKDIEQIRSAQKKALEKQNTICCGISPRITVEGKVVEWEYRVEWGTVVWSLVVWGRQSGVWSFDVRRTNHSGSILETWCSARCRIFINSTHNPSGFGFIWCMITVPDSIDAALTRLSGFVCMFWLAQTHAQLWSHFVLVCSDARKIMIAFRCGLLRRTQNSDRIMNFTIASNTSKTHQMWAGSDNSKIELNIVYQPSK